MTIPFLQKIVERFQQNKEQFEGSMITREQLFAQMILLLLIAVLYTALVVCIIQLLWNAVVVKIANVRPITFWHALGLKALFLVLLL
jgi:hypothetical protein